MKKLRPIAKVGRPTPHRQRERPEMHLDDARAVPDPTIPERFAWAHRQGHPRYVWPEVEVREWTAACRSVETAIAAGLALDASDPPPHLDARPDALAVAAFTTGCGGLLGHWLEIGRLSAPGPVGDALLRHLHYGRQRARRLARVLDDAAEAMATEGVDVVLFKGGQTARTLFDEPALRPMADLDLLVRPAALGRAEAALARAGFDLQIRQREPERSTWAPPDSRPGLQSVHVPHPDNPLTVDLHASLARSYYGVGVVDPGLPGSEVRVPLPGAPVSVTGLEDARLWVVLAAHASEDLHNLQLVRLVELVLLGRSLGRKGAWGTTSALARRAGSLHFLYPALALTHALAPDSVDPGLLAEARSAAPARMVRVVASLTPGTAQRLQGLALEERFMWARGPVEIARRTAHMLVPASAGGSAVALARLYRGRAYRLLRGRVRLRTDQPDRTGAGS
ncbi:MAG: nucleotidyltransferase family protein [Longimicrobiales bacterium]